MAKRKLITELKGTSPELDKGVFIVTTNRDGYYDIHKGCHTFMVLKGDEGAITVHPVDSTLNPETDEAELLVANAKKNNPIIIAEDNEVFFEANTLVDPYNASYAEKVEIGTKVEDKIIDAFEAYVGEAFKFGSYYTFYIENENQAELGVGVEREDKPKEEPEEDGKSATPEEKGDTELDLEG